MRFRLALAIPAVALAGAAAVPVHASPLASTSITQAAAVDDGAVRQVQYYYYGPPRYRPAPGYYHHGGYYYRRGWYADDVATGLAAGALGALAIGGLAVSGALGAAPAPMAPPRRQWCMDRFRSYNPVDGTYIDKRGRVRFCG
jgi:hypothetical protein